MSKRILLFFFALIVSSFLTPARADDHFVEKGTREYMGSTMTIPVKEVWSNDKATRVSDQLTVITRHDLGRRWVLNLRAKRYLEEPIEPEKNSGESAKPTRTQELGFEYRPVYDWTVTDTGQEKVIDGRRCRLYEARGEADYAEQTRELWLTKDLPIDVKRVQDLTTRPEEKPFWQAIYRQFPQLAGWIALERTINSEPAIAPASIYHYAVTTVESVTPPAGTYEVPADFQKVNTREELTRR